MKKNKGKKPGADNDNKTEKNKDPQ